MANVRDLLRRLGEAEEGLRARRFLAPCVRGGEVRANVGGLVYTFAPAPRDFEGWAVFRPADERTARVVEEAELPRVAEYLSLFPSLRVRLAYNVRGATWVACPANVGDAQRRFPGFGVRPPVVHLVSDGQEFEQVVVRAVGGAWLFEDADRRADPLDAERLREAWRIRATPDALEWKGCTPEMRACYALPFRREEAAREHRRLREERSRLGRDGMRLRDALRFGGGDLNSYRDRGDHWLVEWTARDGEPHTSAISKRDLTVVSAGICLSGEDDKFDLHSLVGVVAGAWD
ncbi:MAG TPA: hypothetical protein VE360_02135 [Pyrinomonadaceae bacterium]|jgi:hypothetical protein|nr:hypothetical protein [Pyrinomonadaceae bacterium]